MNHPLQALTEIWPNTQLWPDPQKMFAAHADFFKPFFGSHLEKKDDQPEDVFDIGFFPEKNDVFRRNNAYMKEIGDNYGRDYVIGQLMALMGSEKLNGGLTGDQEKEGCFPGNAYNAPAAAYLCEVLAIGDKARETIGNEKQLKEQLAENKEIAYRHFVATIALWSEHTNQEIKKIPSKEQIENVAQEYLQYHFPSRKGYLKKQGLFPNAEILEDHVQQILNIDAPGNAP